MRVSVITDQGESMLAARVTAGGKSARSQEPLKSDSTTCFPP